MSTFRGRLADSERQAWWLIAFLWAAYFLNYCDRQLVYAIFPILRSELGFTNTQLGLTGSLFLWANGLASPFAGILSERFAKRWLIIWNLLLWSAVTFLTGLTHSAGSMLTGRALLGLTEALFVPLAISLIGTALPPALRARAVGLFFTAQLCGVVAGGSLGGWIAEHWGWRLSFFALGVAGAIFAAPLLLFFRNFQEPKIVERPSAIKTSAFGELAKSSMYVSLCFCFPASLMIVTILYGWLPNFLHEKFSLGLGQAGFMATAYLQTGTALGLLGGSFFSDRLYRNRKEARFWLLAAAMLFGAPWVYLIGHGSSLELATAGAAGFGFANGVYTANIMIAPFDVVPVRSRTAAIAVINTIAPPFSGLATLLTGVWKESLGVANMLSLLALVTVICGLVLLIATAMLFKKDAGRQAIAA